MITLFIDPFYMGFPDMPCMKRIYRDKKCRSTGQRPETKSGRRPADKPDASRWSTAGFVPLSVYIELRLFVLSERRS